LGVGLAVTKEIVDRHKGYITVESELGKGTTFTLHLPRVRFSLVGAEEADLERDMPVEE
jgi:signal transduction histidine kinase